MKQSLNLGIANNYRLTIATEEEIVKFLSENTRTSTENRNIIRESFRSGGWALSEWLKFTAGKILPQFTQAEYHNIVPNVLRYEMALLISGTTITPTLKANYFALGTGSSVPSNSDTQLQTESTRAAFTQRTSYQNTAYLDVFFPSTTVGGNTYTEAGIFVDGSASADSGYLLSRVAINQVLGATQTLTVNSSITIS